MFRTLVATPLIVIDGRSGPVQLGDLPMYRLPAVILALLGDERPSVMRLTASPDRRSSVRPLPGLFFITSGDSLETCRDGVPTAPASCESYRRWLQALDTVTRDVFSGNQHSVRQLPRFAPRQREAAAGTGSPLGGLRG